ncbi:MAG TPA: helix-hairpin-helix domain-containing protein [Steroidobacteraceae bacterium]|nr:helix-hairpin-helix domain-containing protein [Steroidobacteraceae bacterium]
MGRILALALCLVCSPLVAAAELGVLAPVIVDGQPLMKRDAKNRELPVVTRVTSGALYDQLQKEAREGFTATVLALDELAQRRSGTAAVPTWLYLAVEDGGFARAGFWLRDERGEHFVPDAFVDLVVDADTVANGGFEEIFAHEMGHVFLRRLFPSLPFGYSRTPHMSLAITDYPTAFDEGFATHFQPLVRRLTRNAALRDEDLGLSSKPFVPYWLSNLDRSARTDGVRRNWFVQLQAPQGSAGSAARSTLFDVERLKNGNQMLASEGVVATLFYRWLVPGPGDERALLERYGRMFDALAALDKRKPGPDSPLMVQLVDSYRSLFPQESDRMLTILLDTTYGATADASLTPAVESVAARGRSGDMEAFVGELTTSRKAFAKLRESVLKDPATAGAALGPNLWLLSDTPMGGPDPKAKTAINLNTAERDELLKLPGIDAASADKILASRRRDGLFRNLGDFAARAGLSADAKSKLAEMTRAMEKAGVYSRE